MKNEMPNPRPGTGCPVSEAEVLPQYLPEAPPGGALAIGPVRFDRATTLESPCFWVLVGGVSVGVLVYLMMRESRR